MARERLSFFSDAKVRTFDHSQLSLSLSFRAMFKKTQCLILTALLALATGCA